MIKFFGAFQEAFRKPFLNKNNNLNTCANLVAEILDNAYFICMTREPVYLAQSLLKARMEIQGDINTPYGLCDPRTIKNKSDYIKNVCEQVRFHEKISKEQQEKVGSQRFWIVSYEEFCRSPAEFVCRVSEKILSIPINEDELKLHLKPFEIANKKKIDSELFERIKEGLQQLKN
jgi:hypothetical protein